ncbi:Rrf2 family transcriptional regulator [uncultured Sneathiella sp.]|uniref:RrF2 family transcriptional regulator n=1 Tax=uncultured Sneathiella sp. TaxID=879315 RepID=UPI0030EDC7DB|tara:strand:- start:16319 stop:16732 length:414 start_codon:yes stop_codon:yes gene_type:complete
MRLTKFTDIALRVLMVSAHDISRTYTADEIARELKVSHNHLTKVIRDLAKTGILATQRGSGGGFRLARAPHQITLGEVVRGLEGDSAIVECFRPDGGNCSLTPHCKLKGRLATAREAFLRDLDKTSIAECLSPAHAF